MRGWRCVPPLLALGACTPTPFDTAPSAPIPSVCEEQVYADPVVKDLILKSAGSDTYRDNHVEQLRIAKIDAAHRCMQLKGLSSPGGGVARPTVRY